MEKKEGKGLKKNTSIKKCEILLYHHLEITHGIIWASYNMRFLKDFFPLVFVVGESFSQIIVREAYIVIFTVNNWLLLACV